MEGFDWKNSDISSVQSDGKSNMERQTSGRPRFGMPELAGSPAMRDRLLGALMGFRSGMEASQGMISQGNPVGAALMGLAGSMPTAFAAPEQLYNQRIQEDAKTRLAQFEMTPIKEISKPLAEKFGIGELPIAALPHVAPIIQRSEAMETQLAIAAMRDAAYRERLNEMRTNDWTKANIAREGIAARKKKSLAEQIAEANAAKTEQPQVSAPPPPKPGLVRVRRKSDGKTGWYAPDFDTSKYEAL